MSTVPVPFLDLVAQQAEVLDDVMTDLAQVMASLVSSADRTSPP